jgi:hypothetical protein
MMIAGPNRVYEQPLELGRFRSDDDDREAGDDRYAFRDDHRTL